MLNREGRSTSAGSAAATGPQTISGDRGLDHEEPLLFEVGRPEVTGVDLPEVALKNDRLGGLMRREPIGLAGLSEPEAMRHYVRLSQRKCIRCNRSARCRARSACCRSSRCG
jgi:glycine dehydrogenase subunit 2